MYIIYGSNLCPDCIEAKRNFDEYKIDYKFIDILSSLSSLKEFLKLRDNNSYFDKAKNKGLIGIPLIIDENNNFTYYYDKIIESKGFKVLDRLNDYSSYLNKKEEKIICSLDNKEGC